MMWLQARLALALALLGASGCPASAEHPSRSAEGAAPATPSSAPAPRPASALAEGAPLAPAVPAGLEVATFAGGCFWCMEPPFEKMSGVKEVLSGYTGGREPSPSYEQVGEGRTGHTEAVRVLYDPDYVTYEELLDTFWRNVDPTDAGGQFVDRGSQYRTGIFVHSEAQRIAAEASKAALAGSKRFDRPIVTPVEAAMEFWVAEDYHQDFYKKKPAHYQRYRSGSGRDGFLERVWGRR